MDRKGGVVLKRDETEGVIAGRVDGPLLAVLAKINGADVLRDIADLGDVDVCGEARSVVELALLLVVDDARSLLVNDGRVRALAFESCHIEPRLAGAATERAQ